MSVAMNVWSLVAIVIVSMLTGFFAGKTGGWGEREEQPEEGRRDGGNGAELPPGAAPAGQERLLKKEGGKKEGSKKEGRRIPVGWAIGSPVAGQVDYYYEGDCRGAMIRPGEGTLFAPAPGKVVRLYPTGNALRLRTDYGVELLLRVGVNTDELEGRYFRPRVVQNEVVRKGQRLLEYDLEALEAEGYDTAVSMSVEEADDYRDITVTEAQWVKSGEALLWVRP